MIIEAGRLITESLGKLGKIYRTGGDEYYGLFQKSVSMLTNACIRLNQNGIRAVELTEG